jgi:FkbM family methyltransferase
MPSVENLDFGVEKLDEVSVETLRSAVLRLLDPVYREALAAGAKAGELQTWENFGLQACRWVSGGSDDSATKIRWEFRPRVGEPPMVSSAQNLEDVMLARVFRHKPQGFYIDVGAMDPRNGSVTRYFYDLGWRGINIEPDPRFFGKLVDARPKDINLQVVLSNRKGLRELYVLENIGMSTTVQERAEGYRVQEQRSVEARTLADVCEEYAPREIDFLKVDVEGAEADVLRGGDWLRFRPKIVVVESTAPFSYEPTWQQWHPLLTLVGYQMVYEDGINRFYCRGESAALAGAFRLPPNVLDHYTTAECVEERRIRLSLEDEVVQLRQEILELRQRHSEIKKKSQAG